MTTGGGPFFSPGLDCMLKSPTWVLLISSSADSKTSRTGTAATRSRSHSTWSKSNNRLPKKTSAPSSAASTSLRRAVTSRSEKTRKSTPGALRHSSSATCAYRPTLKLSKPEMRTMRAATAGAGAPAGGRATRLRAAGAARPAGRAIWDMPAPRRPAFCSACRFCSFRRFVSRWNPSQAPASAAARSRARAATAGLARPSAEKAASPATAEPGGRPASARSSSVRTKARA